MTLLESAARQILRSAFDDPIGIIVHVHAKGDMVAPALRAKQVLYRFKKENRDFDCLQILLGDDPDRELWILKRQPEDQTPEEFPQDPLTNDPRPTTDNPIDLEL